MSRKTKNQEREKGYDTLAVTQCEDKCFILVGYIYGGLEIRELPGKLIFPSEKTQPNLEQT